MYGFGGGCVHHYFFVGRLVDHSNYSKLKHLLVEIFMCFLSNVVFFFEGIDTSRSDEQATSQKGWLMFVSLMELSPYLLGLVLDS